MEGGPPGLGLRIAKPAIYSEEEEIDPAVVAEAERRAKNQRNRNRANAERRTLNSNSNTNEYEETWKVNVNTLVRNLKPGNENESLEQARNISWANKPSNTGYTTPRNKPIRRNRPPQLKRTYGKRKLINRNRSPVARRNRRTRRNQYNRKSHF